MVACFHPNKNILIKRTKFVKEIGTGLNGTGIAKGARMQVTAVNSAVKTNCCVVKKGLDNFEFGVMIDSP